MDTPSGQGLETPKGSRREGSDPELRLDQQSSLPRGERRACAEGQDLLSLGRSEQVEVRGRGHEGPGPPGSSGKLESLLEGVLRSVGQAGPLGAPLARDALPEHPQERATQGEDVRSTGP